MSPGRLHKRLKRAFTVSWRDQPTRYDIEALQENIHRVGLVVHVRWLLIVVLVVYSLIAGALYMLVPDANQISLPELARLMLLPAASLAFVVLYNAYYALNYRRLGNITVWNNLQLALDAMVVTVLVYFSGGVDSWFWSMYALFVLEAAFILPTKRSAWIHAIFSGILLGAVELSEFAHLLPHQSPPFGHASNYQSALFVGVRYLWQIAVLMGVASVATKLVGEFRREIEERCGQSLLDSGTGLYSRSYFLRALGAEVRRADRDNRVIHVILMDLDHFGDFNRRFGFDTGDQLLRQIAEAISTAVEPAGDVMTTANVMARYGGEEFVLLYSEDARLSASPKPDDAAALAERIRKVVANVSVAGAGVTVSVGVSSLLRDGRTVDDLLDAADDALASATQSGGNRVRVASQLNPVSD